MLPFVIIGSGVIGTTIALELAKRRAGPVVVLEKEDALARHASGRNSGVVHSGINQKPGNLKARMCVEGSRLLREYCVRKGVPMVECGTLVAARSENDMAVLHRILDMGRQCGVPGLKILSRSEFAAREPVALGIAALLSPTGATVDSPAFLESLARDAREAGVEYRLGQKALRIDGCDILTRDGTVRAGHIVNCAGLYADEVAHQMGIGGSYRVIPFRGEYMEVKGCDVRGMIYQPPDLRFPFLSIHLTRETDGRVLAGPSAVLSFGKEAYNKEWKWGEMISMFSSRQFLSLMLRPAFLALAWENGKISFSSRAFLGEIQSLVSGVTASQLVPSRAGIRAQMVDANGRLVDDLLVVSGDHSTHVLNAVSPGLTSSLAFAPYVADQVLDPGVTSGCGR